MKHFFSLLLGILSLAWASSARASNFCPFRPGETSQFSQVSADSIYSLRLLRPGYAQGLDSVYYFNSRLGPSLYLTGATNCRNFRYSDNLFGGKLEISDPGTAHVEYRLKYGDYPPDFTYFEQYVLRPRYPLNQSWSMDGLLTARVTARGMATVLGQPDSVVTITFSDGRLLRLSKNYGLLEAPVLRDYVLRSSLPPRQLLLSGLPARRLGLNLLTPQAIYDFQPGDVFWYNTYRQAAGDPTPGHNYNYNYTDSVLTRTASVTGDTLSYVIWRCEPAQPAGAVYGLVVSARNFSRLTFGTGEYVPGGLLPRTGGLMHDATRATQWNNRAVWRYNGRYMWQSNGPAYIDSVCLNTPTIDGSQRITYAAGLGQTNYMEQNTTCCIIVMDLIGYRKGTERWGTTPALTCRTGLPARASRPARSTTAFPNPFGPELAVSFTLTQAQPVGFTLRDALGRPVLERAATLLAAGARQLVLPTAGLPAGAYTLHLHLGAEGRTEVLRVLKAQ